MMSLSIRLMRYKSRSIHLEHEDVIHNSYCATIHELHIALVT